MRYVGAGNQCFITQFGASQRSGSGNRRFSNATFTQIKNYSHYFSAF
jgi:hypothetical protein